MKTQLLKTLITILIFNATISISVKGLIIYHDVIPNATITCSGNSCNQKYNIDLNNDSVIDFELTTIHSHFNGGMGIPPFTMSAVSILPKSSNAVATDSNYVSQLIAMQSIDSSLLWHYSTGQYLKRYFQVASNPQTITGLWSNALTGYLGLKLVVGAQTYYGWLRMQINVSLSSASMTIMDFAYNSIPNQPILAGEFCATVATLSVNGNTTLCHSDSVTLSMTPGYLYLWSNGETNSEITVSPIVSTNYSVLLTDTSLNCTSTFAQQIIVLATNTSVTQICHSLISGAIIPATIQWYDCSSWQPVTGATQQTFIPSINGNYAAIISNSGCVDTTLCYNVDAVSISLSGNSSICTGDSVSISATSGFNYIWSTGETTNTITVSPSLTTNYTVAVADSALGCTTLLTQNINVNSVNASINGVTSICEGNSTTLMATGGTSYLWNTGSTTASITVSPLISTTYFVAVNNSTLGCSDSVSQQVIVNSVSASLIQTNDSLIALGGDSASIYQWIDCTSNLQIAGANSNVFISQLAGIYAAIIISNGCTDTSNCILVTTGIAEHYSSNHFSIYPNPATNTITIKIHSDETGEIQIVNTIGEIVYPKNPRGFENLAGLHDLRIDVSKFPAGMYVVRWISGENYQTQKFSVTH